MRKMMSLVPLLLLLSGCHSVTRNADPRNDPSTSVALSGQPSWFPIGPEIYQERDVGDAEQQLLSLRSEPRWFLGFPKLASRKEYDAYLVAIRQQGTMQLQDQAIRDDGKYVIPSVPMYPKKLEDLPLEDQGVRLSLGVLTADDRAEVILNIEVVSRDKPLTRRRCLGRLAPSIRKQHHCVNRNTPQIV